MLAEWVEVSVLLVGLEEVLVVVANISAGLLLLLDHGRAWGLESVTGYFGTSRQLSNSPSLVEGAQIAPPGR